MDTLFRGRTSVALRLFEETRDKAVALFRAFMDRESLSARALERGFGIPESTTRSFLSNSHKRGPHRRTYEPFLDLALDAETREALLDFLYFEERVRWPKLKAKSAIPFPARNSA